MNTSCMAILGMGLMGGSLAWAIKDKVGSMVAADPDDRTRDLVRDAGLVKRIASHPKEILPGTDVVILAAPVGAILDLIPRLPAWHPGRPIVLDMGSTKRAVCQRLANLPPRFDVLGGHPMCGKAVSGFEHADPTIFQGATFAFSALRRTSERARSFAERLTSKIGAEPLWVGAERHDELVGATSHLPYLMSAAQVLITPEGAKSLMGSGYRSSTRLASTPSSMMLDVLRTNRTFLLQHIGRIQRTIAELEGFIREGNFSKLQDLLDEAASMKSGFDQGI